MYQVWQSESDREREGEKGKKGKEEQQQQTIIFAIQRIWIDLEKRKESYFKVYNGFFGNNSNYMHCGFFLVQLCLLRLVCPSL